MTILTQNGLTKVASHLFAESKMDFLRDERGDIYTTSEQIGIALGYSHPIQAIQKLFERHESRLAPNSVVVKLTSTDGKAYETRLFNEKGIYEIIRKSGQPKADQFYDWVYEVVQTIRKTGSYVVPVADKHTAQIATLEMMLDHAKRLQNIEQRISTVENDVTLSYGEQRGLQKAISRRVYELQSDAAGRPEYFRQIHREIRDRWGVASYRDVRRIELDEVLSYIKAWKPKLHLVR